ncbi:hypothetical protein [Cytophaga aurantiaca]|uniref:hypothetical protein n=1 Tax=Cytophaga aurantiaca TaxID=29530 RepID=UPI00035ECA0F|nr:hypothetical protein [Cytophaga aurantiaca]
MKKIVTTALLLCLSWIAFSQSIELSNDFRLASPYHEPDGANDVVRLKDGDFVTIAKLKGGISGKSDFAIERNNGSSFKVVWSTLISVSASEDFKDLYFNGKDLVLLSVIHLELEKKTQLVAYGYDVKTGSMIWTKELESYTIAPYIEVEHRGSVKESFIDVICEHTSPSFVTPFEYKHNVRFSPDESKFVSYVFDFSQHTLVASVAVYDNAGTVLKKGKVTIDAGYVNHGIFVNNRGELFIVNVNGSGKINIIRLNLDTHEFQIVEIAGSNYKKDELITQLISDDKVIVGAVELFEEKLVGVTYAIANFVTLTLDKHVTDKFDAAVFSKVSEARKALKYKGEENWVDYDLSHMFVSETEGVILVLEKRSLYADGYPHISPTAFDKKHQVEVNGHVHAEGILLFSYGKDDVRKWVQYVAKNQVYPSTDGLNTISYVIDNSHHTNIRIMYATSESMDGSVTTINLTHIDRASGKVVEQSVLPNESKLMIVRDYTMWEENDKLIVVGRKGITGKASAIVRYKL